METSLQITLSHLSPLDLLSCLSLPYWHLALAQTIVFLIILPSAELFLTELRAGVVVYSQTNGISISINHFRRVNPWVNWGNTLTFPNACSMFSTFGFLDAKLACILWMLGNFSIMAQGHCIGNKIWRVYKRINLPWAKWLKRLRDPFLVRSLAYAIFSWYFNINIFNEWSR